MNRRGFMAGILAAGVAPYVSTMAGVLMPVRQRIAAPEIAFYRGHFYQRESLALFEAHQSRLRDALNMGAILRDCGIPTYMLKELR